MIGTFTLQQLTESFIIRVIVYNIGAGYITILLQNTIIIAIIILTTLCALIKEDISRVFAYKKGSNDWMELLPWAVRAFVLKKPFDNYVAFFGLLLNVKRNYGAKKSHHPCDQRLKNQSRTENWPMPLATIDISVKSRMHKYCTMTDRQFSENYSCAHLFFVFVSFTLCLSVLCFRLHSLLFRCWQFILFSKAKQFDEASTFSMFDTGKKRP